MFAYKKTAAYSIAFTLFLSVILIIVAYRGGKNHNNEYVLKEYNGTVALFKDNEPQNIYDGVVLSTLPAGDRQRFITGIPVESPEEADAIIEDYDS